VVSAIHLLGAGCQLDSADMNGETPLHSAARDGLLSIVQTMCAYGCSVDVVNKVYHSQINASLWLLLLRVHVLQSLSFSLLSGTFFHCNSINCNSGCGTKNN